MKRKILAWTAAILILAAVSACFLRPIGPNPDFGLVEDIYTLVWESYGNGYGRYHLPGTPLTDCEGDTDILRITEISPGFDPDDITVWLEVSQNVALTDKLYKHGTLMNEETAVGAGTIERWEHGEWVECGNMRDANTYAMMGGMPMYPLVGPNEDYRSSTNVTFPVGNPGRYRLTYRFRDNVSAEFSRYSTGEELYSVSHTFTVPNATNKPFDIVGVSIDHPEFESGFGGFMTLAIRSNCGGTIYEDMSRGSLEKLVEGRWVEVPAPENEPWALESWEYYYIYPVTRYGDNLYTTDQRLFFVDDPDTEYRMTREFVENEDGTGKHYTLQIRFRFAER